ncbi:extracellular solute-binding protein [Paenibacillus sp. HW567]|uniref:extracellular solute-binding protein n=1 Tax=Paenibacillus sp. HW567 TaxID=1034769 RepID=UPI000362291E|nr:extracellular solute-binding protein [Paenibacillus sp. HW567]
MYKKKNIFALMLVLAMLGSLLSACSGGNHSSGNSTANNSESSVAGNSTDSNSADSSGGKDDKSPLTINWFVAAEGYQKKWDTENVLLDKMITDDTGITIKFTSGNDEKLGAMIASGNIPDVVTVYNPSIQRKTLEKSGLVAPLDELIKIYAPDFKVPQSAQDWYRNEDGHYYGLVNFFYAKEKMQEGVDTLATHIDITARKDIMDRLGIKPEDFSTKEGTIEALRKVKAAKIKYNGFDMIPAYFDHYNLIQFFGASPETKDGQWQDTVRTPESLEAFKFLNQLYREGLMPEDSVTLTTDQKIEKVTAGSVFAKTSVLVKWDALYNADPNALFVPVGPIKGDAGNAFHFTPSPLSGWMLTMVGSKSKHQERIVKLLQYLSQDEMSLNAVHGPRGIAWDYDENGKVKFTEQRVKEYAANPDSAKRKYDANFAWLVDWVPVKRTWPAPANDLEKVTAEHDAYFEQFAFNDLALEAVTVEGGTIEAGIEAKIKTNREKMLAKIILAKTEQDVEKLFNQMLKEDDELGFQQVSEYKNKKFQEAKEKLGIKFAWPANQ